MLAAIVLGDLAFRGDLSGVRDVMVYVVGVLTLASAIVYALDWSKHMSADHGPGSRSGSVP
jgi:hypothetical protein